MFNENLIKLLDANSIIIEGSRKSGKITFLFYLIKFFFKSDALVFTAQESFLFNRRIEALSKQFLQFKNLQDSITPYFIDENFSIMKQKYGYDFFLEEVIEIIKKSDAKIVVMHRIGEFFEFQDRHEIENVYKSLIKAAVSLDKKMIFLANTQNENFEYISRIAEEFTDVSINIKNNKRNERIINIKDILHNIEYPQMHLRIHEQNFIFDVYKKKKDALENREKYILIAELDKAHDNMYDIFQYIFNKPNFKVNYADSLPTILQEIFIAPSLIIVLMRREQRNFDTIRAIKKQLPDTKIIAIMDQNFVRLEDKQLAYTQGCDELLAYNFSLEALILEIQKATKTLFYTESKNSLPTYPNILENLEQLRELGKNCLERSVFFTAFTIESKKGFEFVKKTSRQNDFIYQTKHKIYYLAIDTMPKDLHMIEVYRKKYPDLELTCLWEPINNEAFEECAK